ncbi:serine hydrolase domain-containing protein [Sphingomonas sp.]|uniref:serine hydrolase domain-containing protein n=1 Tax=Sphingomonas sp. TaxID=28214 RepID=UPI002C72B270|nr:serine hydrolase domain-containing protein [Sphingomonas sp.]HWK36080.1 serine hydrolase domain-containing protein [Sphingomonas sp.]
MRTILPILVLLSGCAATTPPADPAPPPAAAQPAEARVTFDASRILSEHAAGIADRGTGRRVTPADPVRVASISKLVVALGVMRLVEARTLDLDRDVSDYLGWRLRNPAFPDTPITLRLLLSHRSSLTDGIDYIIPVGVRVQDALADPKAWDAAHAPGTYFRYTNLNFPVIGTAMERAAGERFDRLMQREVFRPLGLDGCYNWSGCSDAAVARAVVLYRANGDVARDDLHGVRPACPTVAKGPCDLTSYRIGDNGGMFSPQGGMNISMRDLARVGQMLLRRGGDFLTPASIATIETPVWTFDGTNGDNDQGFTCQYGLATHSLPTARPGCDDDLFGDGRPRVGHSGEAYALRSGLWIDRARGTGVAFFATAVADGSKGETRFSPQEERLARGR